MTRGARVWGAAGVGHDSEQTTGSGEDAAVVTRPGSAPARLRRVPLLMVMLIWAGRIRGTAGQMTCVDGEWRFPAQGGVCPTCDDGEWNGDEEGVDCGGTCNEAGAPAVPPLSSASCCLPAPAAQPRCARRTAPRRSATKAASAAAWASQCGLPTLPCVTRLCPSDRYSTRPARPAMTTRKTVMRRAWTVAAAAARPAQRATTGKRTGMRRAWTAAAAAARPAQPATTEKRAATRRALTAAGPATRPVLPRRLRGGWWHRP